MSFCDCNQGRWPCTCGKTDNFNDGAVNSDHPRILERLQMKRTDEMKLGEEQHHSAQSSAHFYSALEYDQIVHGGPTIAELIEAGHLLPPSTTEYPSDRRKDRIERFSMAAQLQLMKALAVLGWAAFILELLRV